jgi:hypothetical protein
MAAPTTTANRSYRYIEGKRWYYRLVPKPGRYSLMDEYGLEQLAQHLVVCLTPLGEKTQRGTDLRIYAYFDSYLELYLYQQRFPPVARGFYEIALGEYPQKPHFDIDVDLSSFRETYPDIDPDTELLRLREAVLEACMEQGPLDLERDVLWFTSHGPHKRSFHLVLTNQAHPGNKEAKLFYDKVVAAASSRLDGKYVEFIDSAVYSVRQQFRVVGSQKGGSNRPKQFHEQFTFHGATIVHRYPEDVSQATPSEKELVQLYDSLISFTTGCRTLAGIVEPPRRVLPRVDEGDIEESLLEEAIALFRRKMPRSSCSVRGVNGNMILLQREAPSHCPLCRRSHEHENPYLYVKRGEVYWDCRRGSGSRLLLGVIGAVSVAELPPLPVSAPFAALPAPVPSAPIAIVPPALAAVARVAEGRARQREQRRDTMGLGLGTVSNIDWTAGYRG